MNLNKIGEFIQISRKKNYESVGFTLYDRKMNDTESAFTGDYLYYEIVF